MTTSCRCPHARTLMNTRKKSLHPRSPITVRVFEAFVAELRADPRLGETIAQRFEAALATEEKLSDDRLKVRLREALFEAKEGSLD